jgi:chromosome segregation ATPase
MDSPEGEVSASESCDALSPLSVSKTKPVLKASSRFSIDSADSNYGLSPDVIAMKGSFRPQTTAQGARAKLFEQPSPDVLRRAHETLQAREASHEAEKDRLRVELASLRQEIAGLTSEKRALLQAKDDVRSQIADYESRLQTVSSEIARGAAELNKLQSKYTKTKEVLTGQTAALASEVESKQKEKEALERSLRELDAQKSFLEKNHRVTIDELDGQYRKRQEYLAASEAALKSELDSARLQIAKQAESVTDMSEKLQKILEINKGLEANNKALVKENKGLVITKANASGDADRLRSELEDQKTLVAQLQWMIQNPNEDFSTYSIAKVEAEGAAEVAKSRSITFDKTPKGLPSRVRNLEESDDASLVKGPISGASHEHDAALDPAGDEASRPSLTEGLTLQQRREQQAEADRRKREGKQAARAAKKK